MGQSNIERLPFTDREKEILKSFVALLQGIPNLQKVILFGSYARMEQRVQSDFDILAVTASSVSRLQRGEYCSRLEQLGADLIFYTEEQWKASDCILTNQIRKEGILLWQR